MNFRDFIENIDNPFAEPERPVIPADDLRTHTDEQPTHVEIVVDAKTGQPRQAGAELPEGKFINELRQRAERNLFAFTKGILLRSYLSPSLHTQIALWTAQRNAYRKMLLIPRNHAKTSMISHGLPAHMIIQPAANNIYIPGKAGVDTRILLTGETLPRAMNNLSVIQSAFEGNRLLRGLWPQCCWENPRRQAPAWNKQEMVAPRNTAYPDPTIQAMGVGGAITGARHDVHINDDLVTLEAANSVVVMESAIRWFLASRALFDDEDSLEFTIGTRWAVNDLYEFVQHGGTIDGEHFDADPTVDVVMRAIVEDGHVIYPEKFCIQKEPGKIAVVDLMKEQGTMFPLLYMNSAADPSLVDFDMSDIRSFTISKEGVLEFTEDERDVAVYDKFVGKHEVAEPTINLQRGMPLNKDTYDIAFERQKLMQQPIRKVRSA